MEAEDDQPEGRIAQLVGHWARVPDERYYFVRRSVFIAQLVGRWARVPDERYPQGAGPRAQGIARLANERAVGAIARASEK